MVRLLTFLCVIMPTISLAQTPFVDGPFPTSSMDDDPNLIIVRENYDASKRIQSIYLRMTDGSDDYEVTSGEIFFTNAEMVTLVTSREALKDGDATWGIPGVQYGRNRGLEGLDPENHIPVEDSELDVARIQENSVRFWFGCGRDIDDFRILIRYPEENITSSMSLVLYHRRGPDVEGWPPTDDGGLQIGSIEDVTPDDGLYPNEVFSIERLKLKIEDVDIVEPIVELGTVNFLGGAVGPGVMTIENQYRGSDPDADNGRDQNGDISPVPTTGPLEHLRYEVQPLMGPDGASIPASGIQVLGLPRSLAYASQGRGQISVDTPADLPEGRYAGDITLWEDNNADGEISPDEPTDRVTVVVEVRDRVDAAPDAAIVDAEVDAMPDVMVDAGQDSGLRDATLADSASDTESPDILLDDASEADVRRKQPDAGDSDTRLDADEHDGQQGGPDGEADGDLSDAVDLGPVFDGEFVDLGDAPGQRDWPGVPQGGALMCTAAEGGPLAVLFFLLITPFLRRRR